MSPFNDLRKIDPNLKVHQPGADAATLVDAEALFRLLACPNYPHKEGRGVYSNTFSPPEIEKKGVPCAYTKGAGSSLSLKAHQVKGIEDTQEDPFKAFGGPDLGSFFIERLSHKKTAPRIKGALSLDSAAYEYCAALTVYENLMKSHGVANQEEARAHGLVKPIGVVESPALTSFLNQKIRAFTEDDLQAALYVDPDAPAYRAGFGMVSLEVPTAERVRPQNSQARNRREEYLELIDDKQAFIIAGRSVRELYRAGFGYDQESVHFQQLFRTSASLCPAADFTALYYYEGVEKALEEMQDSNKQNILDLMLANQFKFAPFGLLHDKDSNVVEKAKERIAEFFDELSEGRIGRKESNVLCRLYCMEPDGTRLGLSTWMQAVYPKDESRRSNAERMSELFQEFETFALPDFTRERFYLEIFKVKEQFERMSVDLGRDIVGTAIHVFDYLEKKGCC